MSQSAFAFAAEKGGTVHVWDVEAGGAWLRLRAAVEPPEGRSFQELRIGTDRVRVDLHVLPGELAVELQRWPRRRLVAVANSDGS